MRPGSEGPFHEGYAVTCELMGSYVTVVASNADVAEAIAHLVADHGPFLPPQPALVGRVPWKDQTPPRRQIK